jgi:hypothetical protein
MKKKFIYLIFCFCFLSCNVQRVKIAKRFSEMTLDESHVYLAITLKENKEKKKLLISNFELFSEWTGKSSKLSDFTDDLFCVLKKKYMPKSFYKSRGNLRKYEVDMNKYRTITKIGSPKLVFEKYFISFIFNDGNSSVSKPRYNEYEIEEIKAAIVFLIEKGTRVGFLDYDRYTIYIPPKK